MASAPVPRRRRAGTAESIRLTLADGARTTLHVVAHPLDRTEVRVARLRTPAPLEAYCARAGVAEAIVGGFFVRGGKHDYRPLGELRTRGIRRRFVPFDAPWGAVRACVASAAGELQIDRRPELPVRPRGDLLQAGPLLVLDGAVAFVDDHEGFSAGARQFDSDITAGRYPRAALAIAGDRILAVACDGRADDEAGLTLPELAAALVDLGASRALNLDGGGSTSLVSGSELRNVPREEHGVVLEGGRSIPTALLLLPR